MRRTLRLVLALICGAILSSALLHAGPIPTFWTCVGNCGTLGTDGAVAVEPIHAAYYEYVSTSGGKWGVGILPSGPLGHETNGSLLSTPVFTAPKGGTVSFYFDYVTSDGIGFPDYAWAGLIDTSTNTMTALLATAQTVSIPTLIPTVPGQGMPPPDAILDPMAVAAGGSTGWSPLGLYSGTCYAYGCGNTWWVHSFYTIPKSGSYMLQFGVVNVNDQIYDSGIAIGDLTVTPEPSSLWLLVSGLAGLGGMLRRKLQG